MYLTAALRAGYQPCAFLQQLHARWAASHTCGICRNTHAHPSCGLPCLTHKASHAFELIIDFPCYQGKLDTESLLSEKGVNWTSIRPVYIYGPLNYNPVEEWFFQRIAAKRPIPVPGSGMQVWVPVALIWCGLVA